VQGHTGTFFLKGTTGACLMKPSQKDARVWVRWDYHYIGTLEQPLWQPYTQETLVEVASLAGHGVDHIRSYTQSMPPRRNQWVVSDHAGVAHLAAVTRFFSNDADRVTSFHVSTGCHPVIVRVQNNALSDWCGLSLPETSMANMADNTPFTITKWNVRLAPTCIMCIAVVDAFR
jgi:hypothetical protein